MGKNTNLVLTLGMLYFFLSPAYSRAPQSLIDEIAREYQTFRGQSIKGLTQQPCRAIQFVYDLQERFRQNKDQHTADKIEAVISEGAGVGGIDTGRQATDEERKIAYSALYEAIDEKADIPSLTFEDSSNPILKDHQEVVHSIYLSRRDPKLSLKSSDFLKDDSSYRTLTQLSQEHSEQYIKNMSSLEKYLKKTKILEQFIGQEKEQLTQTLRKSLTKYIVENNNKWIDPQDLKVAEQFFLNLSEGREIENINLIKLLFGTTRKRKVGWDDFRNFCRTYQERLETYEKRRVLPVYLAFFNEEEKKDFLVFSTNYLENHNHWGSVYETQHLLKIYQFFPEEKQRQDFLNFCSPYIEEDSQIETPSSQMASLLEIYQFFANVEERQAFLKFCKPYQIKDDEFNPLAQQLKFLFPIYQAFSNNSERQAFLGYTKKYLLPGRIPCYALKDILTIYQAFPTAQKRQDFLDFCAPYIEDKTKELEAFRKLLPIYQAFPVAQKRQDFLDFCMPYAENHEQEINVFKTLLPIYQAFPDVKKRHAFLDFCEPFLEGKSMKERPFQFFRLLPIYQDEDRKEDFERYMHELLLTSKAFKSDFINSYLPKTYLKYMRVKSALATEATPDEARIQAMFRETGLVHQLIPVWAEDPLIQQARGSNEAADSHEFDAIYELDRELLWKETAGYQGKKGTKSLIIYNNQNKQDNYYTNKEVEDFIQYLDEEVVKMDGIYAGSSKLTPTKVVSIVKQMLGLVKKGEGTTGGFAPYLGHSMYYAKPDSPKGDEILGRVWSLMKTKAKEKKDEDLKKAVVLAILEAAEVSTSQVDTHCQTRMTGELMKLVSWHLSKSKLRPLIAAADLSEAQTDEDIQNRIITAPERAQQLFKRMKKEDSGNIRKVIEQHLVDGTDPELWERYEAYYDDLYRRTKNEDDKGYKLDESILKRDEQGNLVSFYQADGSKRGVPQIVYYQAEFQVFEKTFTDLMRQEFEEKRGLKY